MSRKNYVFTSESVSEGHPDKLCDRVSDAVLDAFLTEESNARVACETFATTGRVVVGGEVGLSDKQALKVMNERVEDIVRACVKDIGYEQDEFHWNTLKVQNYLSDRRFYNWQLYRLRTTKIELSSLWKVLLLNQLDLVEVKLTQHLS